MPQPKKAATKAAKPVAKKTPQKSDNTKVSKVIKQPGVGPNYSEMNKPGPFQESKMRAIDTADYKAGYRKGISNARSGKLVSPDKKGNPTQAFYAFRNQSGIPLVPGRTETARFSEGRFEGEKRGKKK
jgi:hypothetical protein